MSLTAASLKKLSLKGMLNPLGVFNSLFGRTKTTDAKKELKCAPKGCPQPDPECFRGSQLKLDCGDVQEFFWSKPKERAECPDVPQCLLLPDQTMEHLPLFDSLYYRISDKAKRTYQKTWADCPPKMRKRYCCDLTQVKPPPFERRLSKKEKEASREKSSCECNAEKFKMICKVEGSKYKKPSKCPQIPMLKCKAGRRPPSCYRDKTLSDCPEKVCCPYPAYSECCQAKPARIPGRAPECFCLVPPPMCIVYREMRRRRSWLQKDVELGVKC